MSLELHVFGPAFGLPSIDGDCLASILYVHACIPVGQWQLIRSSPNRNPFRQLPALYDEEGVWVAGFEQIVIHLRRKGFDLDGQLNESQAADREALMCFIRSHGLPLLDLSFYVSSENYTTHTRSALGNMLSWPDSWTIPHRLRDQARQRTDHLGLDALDFDNAQPETATANGFAAQIPKSLQQPKKTMSSIFGKSAQKTRFRLEAIAENFFEPLKQQLGSKEWLVSEQRSTVDCLAAAYLSLMKLAPLPHTWLKEALSGKYANLGDWAVQSTSHVSNVASNDNTQDAARSTSDLPWAMSSPLPWSIVGVDVAESLVSLIPVIRAGYEKREVPGRSDPAEKQVMYANVRNRQALYSQIVSTCIAGGSLLGYLFYAGVLVIPQLTKKSKRDFGEAGLLLGLR